MATFSNPRVSALPCERMRGCSFAADFLTGDKEVNDNNATDTGTGNTADYGLTTDGNGYISYDVVSQPGSFSVVVRFSRASAIANLLVDGDCEASGTSSYTAHNNATLTKETVDAVEGTQYIRVTYNGTSLPGARQTILSSGSTYTFSGSARGDGTGKPTIMSAGVWEGTTSNTWQNYSFIYTASGGHVYFYSDLSSTGYVEFDNLSVKPIELLASNTNLIAGTAADGFSIWIDEDGIKANHSTSSVIPTECTVDLDYADGEIHTVTFVVDQTAGKQYLYVDALTADEQTIATTTEIGTTNPIEIAGDGNDNFIGTIEKVRIFDAVLTEAEHDLYHADTITTSLKSPLAAYRCDSFCDDTSGDKIWDRTTNQNDLYKADRATSAYYPAFQTDKYSFDNVDDYLTNWPTMGTLYTISGAVSTPQRPFPRIQQHNDTTLSGQLTTAGSYWGYLHNLVLNSTVLTQLEKNHAEYQQLYWLNRGPAQHAYHRLITEGTCKVAMFLDADYWVYRNYARDINSGWGNGVTRGGSSGCTFAGATSNITMNHEAGLSTKQGTIGVYGTFTSSEAAGSIIDKGSNYKLLTNGNQLDFNGSTIAHTFSSNEHIAVTFKSGFEPRFYVDGDYIGEGSTTETPDDTDTTALNIGNNNELNHDTDYAIKHVYIGDEPLSDYEVKALYESARLGGATMETGTRTSVADSSSVAVDIGIDPGGPFQLVSVRMAWTSADPTTSESVTIKILDTADVAYTIYEFDPSIDGVLETDDTIVISIDKRYADDETLEIDYANTDTEDIETTVIYQLDESVT